MPEDNKPKKSSKVGETLLGVLGALGSIAGPLMTGQDIDFGLPFKLGAAHFQNKRMETDLMSALNDNPYTQGLPEVVQGAIQQGGVPGLMEQQQQPQQAPLDVTSDDFLRKLTEYRPDLAEKILVSKATQKDNPLLDMMALQLKGKQLNEPGFYEKESLKQQLQSQNRAQMNEVVTNRQMAGKQESARIGREKWSSAEEKKLQSNWDAMANARNMLDQVGSGINQSNLSAILGKSPISAKVGMALGVINEEQVQQYRGVLNMVMSIVKSQSGVQYGFRELQWIKSAQPSQWDSPDMFKRGMSMALNTVTWNHFGQIIRKAERAGNVEVALREGMTPQQIKAWKVLDAQLTNRAKGKGSNNKELAIFEDPNNAKLFDALNMKMIDKTRTK